MLYNLEVSELQERLFRSKKSKIFILKHEPWHTEITNRDYISINQHESESPNLIVEVFGSYHFTSKEEISESYLFSVKVRDEVKEELIGEIDKLLRETEEITVIFGFIFYDRQEKDSNIAFNGITEILIDSSLFFSNMPYKKRFFKYYIDEQMKQSFYKHIHIVKSAVSVLKSEIDISVFINTLKSSIQNETIASFPHIENIKSIIEILNLYPEIRYINEFRLKRINEFAFRTEEILKAFEKKDYKAVRQIGYDIHNIPEFIRDMDDPRENDP